MPDRLVLGWKMSLVSTRVLMEHKSLLFIQLLSIAACLPIPILFWNPFSVLPHNLFSIALMPFLYFWIYFMIIFSNTCIVACVNNILQGKEAHLSDGIGLAIKRLPQIIGWTMISSVVGMILHLIEGDDKDHSPLGFVRQIVAGVLGTAWSLGAFLVIPIFVIENKGPWEAFQESAHRLRDTWSQQISRNLSFALLAVVLLLPAAALCWIATSQRWASLPAVLALGLIYVTGVVFFVSTALSVFKMVVYNYVNKQPLPEFYRQLYNIPNP